MPSPITWSTSFRGTWGSGSPPTRETARAPALPSGPQPPPPPDHAAGHDHGGFGTVGQVDPAVNGFDPHVILQDWDFGQVSALPGGQTLREDRIVAGGQVRG